MSCTKIPERYFIDGTVSFTKSNVFTLYDIACACLVILIVDIAATSFLALFLAVI